MHNFLNISYTYEDIDILRVFTNWHTLSEFPLIHLLLRDLHLAKRCPSTETHCYTGETGYFLAALMAWLNFFVIYQLANPIWNWNGGPYSFDWINYPFSELS